MVWPAKALRAPGTIEAVSDRLLQLTIPLHQQELNDFSNFHTGRNEELLARLGALCVNGGSPGLWLWGPPGRGRSHLLQASCQAVEAAGGRALYLPLATLPRDPQILEGLHGDLLALDDVDAWLTEERFESPLMALYQEQVQNSGHLLLSSTTSAQRTMFSLADLASRLRALPGYEVLSPDDDGLREILSKAARRQGLLLAPGVLNFWLHRSVRSLPVLLDQLAELDARALAEQRRVTIPLIKEVLAL